MLIALRKTENAPSRLPADDNDDDEDEEDEDEGEGDGDWDVSTFELVEPSEIT